MYLLIYVQRNMPSIYKYKFLTSDAHGNKYAYGKNSEFVYVMIVEI